MKTLQICLLVWCFLRVAAVGRLSLNARTLHKTTLISEPVKTTLKSTLDSQCSVMIFGDENASIFHPSFATDIGMDGSLMGYSIFVTSGNMKYLNITQSIFNAISHARQLRRISWCITVVLVSEQMSYLEMFAAVSLQTRFLVWTTRLLVVTRLPTEKLERLLKSHWTFAMMNTMFFNLEFNMENSSSRRRLYLHLPYTPNGPGNFMVAEWSSLKGLQISQSFVLFPEKYITFYGAVVNVTSKPWPPYWLEDQYRSKDGSMQTRIHGTDGLLLHTVAKALNFTIHNIPTDSWEEVIELVISRDSFISPIRYTVLPERLALYDMTYVYDYSPIAFCMAEPPLEHKWQSLMTPLNNRVWLSILGCLLVSPIFLFMLSFVIDKSMSSRRSSKKMTLDTAIFEMWGILFGQNLAKSLPTVRSGRTLMASWLIFAFIIGTAYRGNLTAHLTLPKVPWRPETIDDLIGIAQTVWGASYKTPFKQFFLNSDYNVYRRFGELMVIGPETDEGMELTLENKKTAVMEVKRFMAHLIADRFTKKDGTTDLYIGRSPVLAGRAAWAVPHDAPYTSVLDKSMRAALEAGLYEKWSADIIEYSRRQSIRRQLEANEDQRDGYGQEQDATQEMEINNIALTLTHMRGPFYVNLAGLILAFFLFVGEAIIRRY